MSVIVLRVIDKNINSLDENTDNNSHIFSIIADDSKALYLSKKYIEKLSLVENSLDEKIKKYPNSQIPTSAQDWIDLAYINLNEKIISENFTEQLEYDLDINTVYNKEKELLMNINYELVEINALENTEIKENTEVNDKIEVEYINKIAELTNDIKKVQADFINYKKRIEKNNNESYQQAVIDLTSSLIPLIDDIYRIDNQTKDDPIVKTVKIHLESIMSKYEITAYDDLEKEFDPKYHDAISFNEDNNYNVPIITKVFQRGYIYKDKIIKPAIVEVTLSK